MPVHKIPASSLHEDLIALEREGESVVTTERVGRYVIVVTRFHGNNIETRPVKPITNRLDPYTHAARTGAVEFRNEWEAK